MQYVNTFVQTRGSQIKGFYWGGDVIWSDSHARKVARSFPPPKKKDHFDGTGNSHKGRNSQIWIHAIINARIKHRSLLVCFRWGKLLLERSFSTSLFSFHKIPTSLVWFHSNNMDKWKWIKNEPSDNHVSDLAVCLLDFIAQKVRLVSIVAQGFCHHCSPPDVQTQILKASVSYLEELMNSFRCVAELGRHVVGMTHWIVGNLFQHLFLFFLFFLGIYICFIHAWLSSVSYISTCDFTVYSKLS